MYNSRNRCKQVTVDGVPSTSIFTRQHASAITAIYRFAKGPLQTATTSPRFPAAQFDNQEEVFQAAFKVLDDAIERQAFPGASIAVTLSGRLVALKAFGRFTYEASSEAVTTDSIFDLASVTKVVATTSMAMILYERGLLDLEMPVTGIVPEFGGDDARSKEITIHMLLAHSSGVPAYEKLFLRSKNRKDLLHAVFAT